MVEFICNHGCVVRPGDSFTTDQCIFCWRTSQASTGVRPSPPAVRSLPCIHEEGIHTFCPRGDENLHVRGCALDHENVTRGGKCFNGCGDYTPPTLTATAVRRLDSSRLITYPAGYAFNGSIIDYKGKTLLAYRAGWAGSNCHICELGADDTPGPSTTLALVHPLANFGREDPRLFIFRDQLHISFIGVQGHGGGNIITHQLYARLRDDWTVEEVFAPSISARSPSRPNTWEKNWGFFDLNGVLHAVYSIKPHVVLRIDGERVSVITETPTEFTWHGGYLRGGAPPVLIDGEYWHWFHGAHDIPGGNWPTRQYNLGLCTFEAKSPFRVTRMAEHPLAMADHSTRPTDQYCSVLFPAGTMFDGKRWRVSFGIHDRWLEIRDYAHTEARQMLGL